MCQSTTKPNAKSRSRLIDEIPIDESNQIQFNPQGIFVSGDAKSIARDVHSEAALPKIAVYERKLLVVPSLLGNPIILRNRYEQNGHPRGRNRFVFRPRASSSDGTTAILVEYDAIIPKC